jgi:hypothetical protein
VQLLRLDPRWDPLRAHPRYRDLTIALTMTPKMAPTMAPKMAPLTE